MTTLALRSSLLVLAFWSGTARAHAGYAEELALAQSVAREAGALVNRYRGKVDTEHKDGGEVVTRADRESSALIVGKLRERYPKDLFITEEDKANWSKLPLARRVWFIDPIDGTADYIAGHDGYAVQIGLVEKLPFFGKGKVKVGVVYQPALDRMMFASPATGARMIEAGRETSLRVSSRRQLSNLRLIVSNSKRTPGTDALKKALGIGDEVPMGSIGVKVGFLARAEHDLTFKDNSKAKVWDIAGPQAIIEAAGGRFTTLTGQPFNYQRIATSGGILATNGLVHDAVVRTAAPIIRSLARSNAVPAKK